MFCLLYEMVTVFEETGLFIILSDCSVCLQSVSRSFFSPKLENVFGFNHKYEVKDYLNIKHLRCFQDRPLNFLSLASPFHRTISRQKEITISLELLHFLLVQMINGYNFKSTLDLISIGGHRMLLDSCSSGVELADWESSPTIKSSKYQSRQLFSPSHLLLNSQPLCFWDV